MALKLPRLFVLLLGAVFVLNLVQGAFTELIYDESYYWYYAQNLDWGYFDHPPMVALMIKISGVFFSGELGVRLVSCFLGMGTSLLIWAMVGKPYEKKDIWLFFAVVFAMPLLNAYGFLTLPDTPLLFFTALFLYCYRNFLQRPSIWTAIALGLSMAALMYSKYHAVLVIVFVLVSNWRLVLNKYAWLAVIVSLLCYSPHIFWLWQYDFVTIKYHLSERPNHAYDFSEFTLGYLLNLIIIFGLFFVWSYWALIKKLKEHDLFTKSLTYLSLGVILFFFVSSFDRRVQTQWIVVICVPMAILTYQFLLENRIRKWPLRLGIVSAAILLYARLGLVFQPLFPVVYETHGNKAWTSELKEKSKGRPVVFENSYRKASMYRFYTGVQTFSLNNIHFRLNQYSIDSSEAKMQHKDIVYVTQYAEKGDISYSHPDGTIDYGFFRNDFESFRRLECLVEAPVDLAKESLEIGIYNPYSEKIPLQRLRMHIAYRNEYKQQLKFKLLALAENQTLPEFIKANDTLKLRYDLPQDTVANAVYVKFAISENELQPALNSSSLEIKP